VLREGGKPRRATAVFVDQRNPAMMLAKQALSFFFIHRVLARKIEWRIIVT
jgi:hypothetical protein